MCTVSREFLTVLSGAEILKDEGHIKEAERVYWQLWAIAKAQGNDAEREATCLALVGLLSTQGRTKEAEKLLLEPEVRHSNSARIQALGAPAKSVIVIGSSAGGVEPVSLLLSGLPSDLNAAVLIVQQTPGHSPNELARMLNKRCNLPVAIPDDGVKILTGHVYLAPPNQHLMVKQQSICLGNGPKENRSRPAIDVLFRTAAHAYGPHVIGVVLSGVLNDGTAGLMSIKTHGGTSIVQDPDEAVFDGMPRSAIALTRVDQVLKAAEIGPALGTLMNTIGEEGGSHTMPEYKDQADVGEAGGPGIDTMQAIPPSALTCPSCGGAVWQVQEQSLTLFKCHVGHGYTAELMLEEQSEAVDQAAWVLLRSIDESVYLRRKLAEWARQTGRLEEAAFHEQQAADARGQAEAFRGLLLSKEKGRD